MIKNYLSIQKTARYFQSKKIDEQVKHVLFVFHGYSQNADEFLASFKNHFSEEILIVAPEGLSKFYWKDFSSNPASSWMTSLERENEIADNLRYLSKVASEIIKELPSKGVKYSCLGFSQGAAMASRFVSASAIQFSNLFLYGGGPAYDLKWNAFPKNLQFHLVYGNEDPYLSEEKVNEVEEMIVSNNFGLTRFKYNGKHKIEKQAVDYIMGYC